MAVVECLFLKKVSTVELVLKDRPISHKKVVSQDRWSLVTDSITLKFGTFCQEYLVFQDRWSFMTVVFQDRFYCNPFCCQSSQRTKEMWSYIAHAAGGLKVKAI